MKGYLEGAKEWLGAWAKQVSTSVNSHLQGKDHLKRVKELQESRKQRGLKEDRGFRIGLLEMDRLGDDEDYSSYPFPEPAAQSAGPGPLLQVRGHTELLSSPASAGWSSGA